MGFVMSKVFGALFGSKEVRILILGLDNAGKTTILCELCRNFGSGLYIFFLFLFLSFPNFIISSRADYSFLVTLGSLCVCTDRLQADEVIETVPTIGFNVETLQYKNLKFQVWDLGGQTSIRPYWRCYYANTDAIIFVVDSVDVDRLPVAKSELMAMLQEEDLKDAKLLVFANKQDQDGALGAADISQALGLDTIKNRQWTIQQTCARKGEGLYEGFDWLVTQIKGTQ